MRLSLAALIASAFVAGPALAAPWADPGDARLRSDLAILADAGVVTVLATQWPVPWRGIAAALDDPAIDVAPPFVQAAVARVRRAAQRATAEGTRVEADIDATNRPATIRGFDAQGHEQAQAQAIVEVTRGNTDLRLATGAITGRGGSVAFDADGSYLAHRFGGAEVYGGTVGHWWGPGWVSALTQSTNARPFPQIGIASAGTQRFTSRWLRWIGPWRAEAFVGLLDDRRIARDTVFNGVRVTFMPVRGLEIGLARTQMLCGSGQPCNPLDTFDLRNDPGRPSKTASEGVFDLRYARRIAGHPVEIYTQIMNEDSSPVTHSYSSYLVGGSVWVPLAAGNLRVTGEYTSSIATEDLFGFGTVGYGVSYADYKYPDGFRYRGRALGFSLDSDSRLATLQAALTDTHDRDWSLSLHHALVSRPATGAANPLTTAPVTINYAEARVSLPTPLGRLGLAGRVQDDRLRPARGRTAAVEASLRVRIR